ncbi:Nramp family divalent metal transporter [Thioalkalivibrio sp. XN279]|uniref:Nramp family divalent metal transporter n=1 Tax=Thioalkalivibrio sp. XN279 TaxID=2714953 RepID=UPI001F0E1B17|nr:Nramp family divalent metal transporter [Thioalkalivibrio sp. XN279]
MAPHNPSRAAPALRKVLGPGLLMAGAAVGVSHLVQSTRAGAEYGLLLLPVVLLACLLKYPFLEFGPRYAAATGENLLVGYRRLGQWALWLFGLVTVGTMFIVLAVVTLVTAGLAGLLLGIEAPPLQLSAGVLALCILLLAVGNYRGLDLAMKLLMAVLTVSTLLALALTLVSTPDWSGLSGLDRLPALGTATGIAFLLALVGWMPIPVEVAAWHSLWTRERAAQTGHAPTLAEALTDFRLGYAGAVVLAAAFVLLGALLMHASGLRFADSAVGFSGQLVELYTQNLGAWSRPLITIAALSTMFSTTLAVADAYPRVLAAILDAAAARVDDAGDARPPRRGPYLAGVGVVSGGALLVLVFAGEGFTRLIDFATTLSFVAAPLIAWITLRAVTAPHVPQEARPGPALRTLAWVGLVSGALFSLAWIAWRLMS